MCLAVPGKLTEIYEVNGMKMGKIDFGGAIREVCLEYVPEAVVGDYAIIHVGFALNLISEEEAMESLKLLRELDEFYEEIGAAEDDLAGSG
jgi:hydrogenase expression/formation protein HypC